MHGRLYPIILSSNLAFLLFIVFCERANAQSQTISVSSNQINYAGRWSDVSVGDRLCKSSNDENAQFTYVFQGGSICFISRITSEGAVAGIGINDPVAEEFVDTSTGAGSSEDLDTSSTDPQVVYCATGLDDNEASSVTIINSRTGQVGGSTLFTCGFTIDMSQHPNLPGQSSDQSSTDDSDSRLAQSPETSPGKLPDNQSTHSLKPTHSLETTHSLKQSHKLLPSAVEGASTISSIPSDSRLSSTISTSLSILTSSSIGDVPAKDGQLLTSSTQSSVSSTGSAIKQTPSSISTSITGSLKLTSFSSFALPTTTNSAHSSPTHSVGEIASKHNFKIAGIICGLLILVAICAGVIVFLRKQRKRRRTLNMIKAHPFYEIHSPTKEQGMQEIVHPITTNLNATDPFGSRRVTFATVGSVTLYDRPNSSLTLTADSPELRESLESAEKCRSRFSW